MLSLREFDSINASPTFSIHEHAHRNSTFLEFAAQPSGSLPSFIASFANPVQVHADGCSETASGSEMIEDACLEAAEAQSWELDALPVSRHSQAPSPSQLSAAATVE